MSIAISASVASVVRGAASAAVVVVVLLPLLFIWLPSRLYAFVVGGGSGDDGLSSLFLPRLSYIFLAPWEQTALALQSSEVAMTSMRAKAQQTLTCYPS